MYGLPKLDEHQPERIRHATHVANPGCYANRTHINFYFINVRGTLRFRRRRRIMKTFHTKAGAISMTQARIVIATGDTRLSATIATALVRALANEIQDREIVCVEPDDLKALGADPATSVLIFNTLSADLDTIANLRATRKSLYAVGIKTSMGLDPSRQYTEALEFLKKTSINLVLATDLLTDNNLVVAPEETHYGQSPNLVETLDFLAKMVTSRMTNRFTRSTVIPAETIAWSSPVVPENLRAVVNHCIERGAYKPVLGKTAGHFAVKLSDNEILTSIRKSNFNDLANVGLVRVESVGDNEVIAHGARPSVGGQSQRQIFAAHKETNIAHFHCPVKADAPLFSQIPVRDQWPNECGSHQCGANTSQGLHQVDLGDGDSLKIVFLDNHGPNIVFSDDTPADKIIGFIDANFDLSAKTGGLLVQGVH